MNINELNKTIKQMNILIGVWLLSLFFAAVMLTLGLIYEMYISVICAAIVGVFSLVGIIYCAALKINLQEHIKFLNSKVDN